MQHFFADPSCIGDVKIYIEGEDVNHMKNVLRMKPGEEVRVNDGAGRSYLCSVDGYEDKKAVLNILETMENDSELPSHIWLFQGLPKGDKMEWIVQKAVELGACRIVPFCAKRSVVKLDDKKAEKRQKRWQAVAKGAAEQSGRGIIPAVESAVSFETAVKMAADLDVVLIPYELAEGMETTEKLITQIKPGQSVGIFIGPEGGFEPCEVERVCGIGAHAITLGKRILRTETAGLTALSLLMYHLECAK